MNSNASSFIKNRQNETSITDNRVKSILWYFEECNKIQKADKITYSKSWVKENTQIDFEDYLKFEFIDNYLSKNKHLLNGKFSELETINFSAETQKRYIDTSINMQRVDKIDIFIDRLGIQNEWNEVEENIYFAVECKRIGKLSDTSKYVADIEKFTTRNHTNLRLPFEGQLAFIENESLDVIQITEKINAKLKKHQIITTKKYLCATNINSSNNIYYSEHKKNFNKKDHFCIYHLFLNYSKIVLN